MTTTRDLQGLLDAALQSIPDPRQGLPDPAFRFILRVTPMINVDLLVRNEKSEHLLAWRKDPYHEGWHIPGGIIRFNEPIAERIAAVAREELAAEVRHEDEPAHIQQFFTPRGHFISLLFLCRLSRPVQNAQLWHRTGAPAHGQLRWVGGVPEDIYKVHRVYARWLEGAS